MPSNECNPYYETSDVTFTATAAVTGKRFISPSGNRESGPGLAATADGSNYQMEHAAAGERAAGVSAYDVADGEKGACLGQAGKIVPVTSGAAIAAGAEVEVGTDGKAITLASGVACGLCLSGVGAANLDAEIRLY